MQLRRTQYAAPSLVAVTSRAASCCPDTCPVLSCPVQFAELQLNELVRPWSRITAADLLVPLCIESTSRKEGLP
jgi:hypothetical protein